eukprot:TRINITY_DN3704_c0_g1_i2.p1 TRINITY_DN3704_c0_g1~~TRINITY_DN3704_c0_g1_i2.p1  ORF type:complete len:947 (+),score=171.87 TRINITY_DN3704_c0_g1_i2:34-2841(+)
MAQAQAQQQAQQQLRECCSSSCCYSVMVHKGTHREELSFPKYETVLLQARGVQPPPTAMGTEGEWWSGALKRAPWIGGKFPAKCVRVLQEGETMPAPTVLARVRAKMMFASGAPKDLNFNAGDIINVLDRGEAGWWQGELNGKIGMFPISFISTEPATTTATTPPVARTPTAPSMGATRRLTLTPRGSPPIAGQVGRATASNATSRPPPAMPAPTLARKPAPQPSLAPAHPKEPGTSAAPPTLLPSPTVEQSQAALTLAGQPSPQQQPQPPLTGIPPPPPSPDIGPPPHTPPAHPNNDLPPTPAPSSLLPPPATPPITTMEAPQQELPSVLPPPAHVVVHPPPTPLPPPVTSPPLQMPPPPAPPAVLPPPLTPPPTVHLTPPPAVLLPPTTPPTSPATVAAFSPDPAALQANLPLPPPYVPAPPAVIPPTTQLTSTRTEFPTSVAVSTSPTLSATRPKSPFTQETQTPPVGPPPKPSMSPDQLSAETSPGTSPPSRPTLAQTIAGKLPAGRTPSLHFLKNSAVEILHMQRSASNKKMTSKDSALTPPMKEGSQEVAEDSVAEPEGVHSECGPHCTAIDYGSFPACPDYTPQYASYSEMIAHVLPPAGSNYIFAEPDSDDNVRYKEGKLMGGTLVKLFEKFTDPHLYDIKQIASFVLVHKNFSTTTQLLDLLICRFHVPPGSLPEEVMEKIQFSVWLFLKEWVTHKPEDFQPGTADYEKVTLFIDYLCAQTRESTFKAALQLKTFFINKVLGRDGSRTLHLTQVPPKVLQTVPVEDWRAVNLTEFARQMTLIEFEIFSHIRSEECFSLAWTQKDAVSKSPNILQLTQFFNRIGQWVVSTILTQSTRKDRASTISRFVKLCKEFKDVHNYNGMVEIIAGLQSRAIRRLKKSWKEKSVGRFKEFAVILENNSKDMRELIANTQAPCLPYLGVLPFHLT